MGSMREWIFGTLFPDKAKQIGDYRHMNANQRTIIETDGEAIVRLQRVSSEVTLKCSELIREKRDLNDKVSQLADQLAAKTLELESLKNKIVERAQQKPIIKAKTAADVRRLAEEAFATQEASADGVQ
jgi:hypothetical protein